MENLVAVYSVKERINAIFLYPSFLLFSSSLSMSVMSSKILKSKLPGFPFTPSKILFTKSRYCLGQIFQKVIPSSCLVPNKHLRIIIKVNVNFTSGRVLYYLLSHPLGLIKYYKVNIEITEFLSRPLFKTLLSNSDWVFSSG